MMQLFKKDTQTLRLAIEKYPYFSPALLALTQRLKEEGEVGATELYKTSLYFTNSIWLSFLSAGFGREKKELKEALPEENKISHVLSRQLSHFNEPVTGTEKLFEEPEPLFKTDYFKHQGIEADGQETQLGQKVRKFTDWLKEMKKLNTGAPQFNTSELEEKAAALLAVQSLDNTGVLTEPMAEVLLLQGKKQQAIKVYEKLSLINPEKSTYFASKIQLLQENKA